MSDVVAVVGVFQAKKVFYLFVAGKMMMHGCKTTMELIGWFLGESIGPLFSPLTFQFN